MIHISRYRPQPEPPRSGPHGTRPDGVGDAPADAPAAARLALRAAACWCSGPGACVPSLDDAGESSSGVSPGAAAHADQTLHARPRQNAGRCHNRSAGLNMQRVQRYYIWNSVDIGLGVEVRSEDSDRNEAISGEDGLNVLGS